MASNKSEIKKPANVVADTINPQPQQLDVDAHENSTKMTQLIKTSEPIENTHDSAEPSKFLVKDQLTLESTTWLGSVKAECSLTQDKTLAQFNPNRSGYSLASDIFSQDRFFIERVSIEHGDFKGHQALVLVPLPKKTFDFPGLPAEIRIMIYKLLLTKLDHVIAIQGGRHIRGGFYKDAEGYIRNETRPGNTHPFFKTLTIPTGILRTSHQVHNESVAILYGQNPFRIIATDTSSSFLESIGTNVSLIQHIQFWGEQNTCFRRRCESIAGDLARAKDLKFLALQIFGGVNLNRWGSAPDLFHILKPLLKMLYDREKDIERATEVVKLILVQQHCPVSGQHSTAGEPCSVSDCKKNRVEFEKIVTKFEASARHYLKVGPERRDTGRPKRTTARTIDYYLLKDDE